jgi:ribonuclease P protein component
VNGKYRLTRAIDFKRVRRSGRSYAHPLVVVLVAPGEFVNSRIGIITGRSIGKAVRRNRVKRQIREILRSLIPNFKKCVDIVVIGREPMQKADFNEIRLALLQVLERAEIIG